MYRKQYLYNNWGSVLSPILGILSSTRRGKPIVTGGTLTSDATYYYRTFTGNGTLGVTGNSLSCDALVVAGGGSGAGAQYVDSPFQYYLIGGAGGAGGLTLFTTSLAAINHSVTVGAGGSQNVGGNSSLGSNSTTGGGVYATNGGSGQGDSANVLGGTLTQVAAGPGIAGQGNAGGTGFNGILNGGNSGGGGGSGAAGSGANGGAGTTAYSTWASVTGTGSSGRYAAGGAGAGGSPGTGGGGTAGYNSNGGNAATNTGGGGGGTTVTSGSAIGGNGGSGIVIVRYTKAQVD